MLCKTFDDLREIFAKSHFVNSVEIAAEENGVNLFALARKLE